MHRSTPASLQMQQCGQPPQEIVDELAPGMQVRGRCSYKQAGRLCALPLRGVALCRCTRWDMLFQTEGFYLE